MTDKEKILRYFKASGDEKIAVELLNLATKVAKNRKYSVSDFLDPHGVNVAEIIASNFENIKFQAFGGFDNAERKCIAFISEDYYGSIEFPISCFQVEWDKRYYSLNHRDILGAFMGLGAKRELIGDIVFIPEGAQFVATANFQQYILSNLVKIGAACVNLKVVAQEDLKQKEEKVKIIKATVSKLRLDSVAAAGFGVSRSRMAEEIKGLNVKLNWKEVKSASQAVSEGDVFSFRGRGRVEFSEITGNTKKGRIGIVLKRFI
jgi:RNA-binding protein YlmH